MPLRVVYQGEPGAYSEKSTRELLGENVVAIGRPNFESCFQAVASMECDYACLPFENSLGGSIHENYDLMLRYDLKIVAEHEFRVSHCLLAKPGVERKDIKYAISHPQALAQCDNFLRGLGITPIPVYDTAGAAKMISEGSSKLPPKCTPENTAAIASDLAGKTYQLNCLNVSMYYDRVLHRNALIYLCNQTLFVDGSNTPF
jgi:prephenate dehydratase